MSDNTPTTPVPGEPFVFPLVRPIQAHNEERRSLTFRPVKGSDIRRLGIPFRIDAGGVTMDDGKMMRWIGELAQIPDPSVDQIHPSDLLMLQTYLPLFFAPPTAAPAAISGASSNPPSSLTSTAAPLAGGAIQASLS